MELSAWDALAVTAGRWIADGYVAYAFLFLMAGVMFGLHAIVLVLTIYWWRRPTAVHDLVLWPIDLAYGLVNPLIYLVILNEGRREWDAGSGLRDVLTALPPQPARMLRRVGAVLLIASLVASASRWTGAHARALVVENRFDIRSAAAAYDVGPVAIAAVMYVTQRDQLSPMRDLLERTVASAWSVDEHSNYVTEGLNLSLGIMQIKPTTLQTTARIRDRALAGMPEARVPWSGGSKEMRGLPDLDSRWQLPPDPLRRFAPWWKGGASRPQVLKALLDDRQNIHSSALILALYQVQWESADPSWSIRGRPDVLATLYQIGFERSRPHAEPRSNRFGQRVLEATRLPWLQEAVTTGAARLDAHRHSP